MLAFQRILALILAVLMNLGIWAPSSYEIKNVPEKNEESYPSTSDVRTTFTEVLKTVQN